MLPATIALIIALSDQPAIDAGGHREAAMLVEVRFGEMQSEKEKAHELLTKPSPENNTSQVAFDEKTLNKRIVRFEYG